MYPGPNHMRDRHGNNPDSRPDQRMPLNSNLEKPRRDVSRLEEREREKQRQAARAMREKGRFPHPITAIEPEPPSPAMFTLVKRSHSDNVLAKILGPFANFAGSDQNLELMGVDQQPSTPAPAMSHHHNGGVNEGLLAQRQAHRHSSNSVPSSSRTNSSSSFKSPAKLASARSSCQHNENVIKPPHPTGPKQQISTPLKSKSLTIDDPRLIKIFGEMDDLQSPIKDMDVTPVRDPFPSPKKDLNFGKSNPRQTQQTQPLKNYHSDFSDDSDLESSLSGVKTVNPHPPAHLRKGSTTSQNSDDSSNSEDSSCSDSDDSSTNSSEEEDKPAQPEQSQMPSSPVSTSTSWSLESIFKQENGCTTKDDIGRDQEMAHKPYDGPYDSLSRSPHRTDLAPPVCTKEPVGRIRRLTETSEDSTLDSSINSCKKEKVIAKYFENRPKSPGLSESELEQDTTPTTRVRASAVSGRAKEPSYENNKKSSVSKPVRERSGRKTHTKQEKVGKMVKSIETIPSDLDTDSDDCSTGTSHLRGSYDGKRVANKAPSKGRMSRKDGPSSKSKSSSRHSAVIEMSPPIVPSVMSPPVVQEVIRSSKLAGPQRDHRYPKPVIASSPSSQRDSRHRKTNNVMSSPAPLQRESRCSTRSSERADKESPSSRHSRRGCRTPREKPATDRSSRKAEPRESDPAPRAAKRNNSPSYTLSVKNKLRIPKIAVCSGEFPSAVLRIPTDFVKQTIATDPKESPVKKVPTKEVIEMRTSPSNEDAKKLRAICSIYKGSKKRPSSQEPERTLKSVKVDEPEPIKIETKPDIVKEKSPRTSTPRTSTPHTSTRTSTPQPESTHRHSSSRHRISKDTEIDKDRPKERDKYSQPKDEKKRRRRVSDEQEQKPKKRNRNEVGPSGHEFTESKARNEKKESYRSYVKEESSSPVQRSSCREKDNLSQSSSRNTSQNVDIQEFAISERNSDDDSCFRTPQQVQSYGCKETNQKRQKVEVSSKGTASVHSQGVAEPNSITTPHQVSPNPSYFSYLEKRVPAVETDHMQYLLKAKELKHMADKESNRTLQVMIYLESGLYFILTGESMEQETTNVTASFSMYNDTLKFIRHVSSIIVRKDSFKEDPAHNNLNLKLAVLSLRCQSLLYLKLYTMRAGEANEVQKDLAEYFKVASKSPTVPMTYSGAGPSAVSGICGSRMANSPSSLSPTPSPAGSVGSEGSQSSSGYGTEGASQRAVAGVMSATPPMMPTNSAHLVPKHTFVSLQRHLSISNFLVAAHHHWKESEAYIYECNTREFFIAMDHQLGPLTLHSTPSELVMYVQKSLDKLKAQQCIGGPRSNSSMA